MLSHAYGNCSPQERGQAEVVLATQGRRIMPALPKRKKKKEAEEGGQEACDSLSRSMVAAKRFCRRVPFRRKGPVECRLHLPTVYEIKTRLPAEKVSPRRAASVILLPKSHVFNCYSASSIQRCPFNTQQSTLNGQQARTMKHLDCCRLYLD